MKERGNTHTHKTSLEKITVIITNRNGYKPTCSPTLPSTKTPQSLLKPQHKTGFSCVLLMKAAGPALNAALTHKANEQRTKQSVAGV